MPSGRFPSSLNTPTGSKTAGIPPDKSSADGHIMTIIVLFLLFCLFCFGSCTVIIIIIIIIIVIIYIYVHLPHPLYNKFKSNCLGKGGGLVGDESNNWHCPATRRSLGGRTGVWWYLSNDSVEFSLWPMV